MVTSQINTSHIDFPAVFLHKRRLLPASAIGHLVDGGERSEDAALVCFNDAAVLNHLVQDDVNRVQVKHDLIASQSQGETSRAASITII